jgi:hypothetical protein
LCSKTEISELEEFSASCPDNFITTGACSVGSFHRGLCRGHRKGPRLKLVGYVVLEFLLDYEEISDRNCPREGDKALKTKSLCSELRPAVRYSTTTIDT